MARIPTHTQTPTHTHTHIYIYIYTYMYICLYTHVYIYIYMHLLRTMSRLYAGTSALGWRFGSGFGDLLVLMSEPGGASKDLVGSAGDASAPIGIQHSVLFTLLALQVYRRSSANQGRGDCVHSDFACMSRCYIENLQVAE